MVYKHAVFFLHSALMLSMVKMPPKGEVGGHALNSHGNYIVDQGKSWKNHGIVFLNFCGNPESILVFCCTCQLSQKTYHLRLRSMN